MIKQQIINHRKVLQSAAADNFETLAEEQISKLRRYFKRYGKPVQLEVILSQDDRQYLVTLVLNLRSGPLIVRRKGSELWPLMTEAFKVMRNEIVNTLEKERKEHLHKKKTRYTDRIDRLAPHLSESRRESDFDTFLQLFKTGMPELIQYLNRRLKPVARQEEFAGLQADEMVNELLLRIYDRFDELPEKRSEVMTWIYQMADNLLEEKLKEVGVTETESFEGHADDDELREPEITFSVDAEGEMIPLDELDDPVHIHNLYAVEEVFVDDAVEAGEIRQKLDERMTPEEVHHLIDSELTGMPHYRRSIFDLYVIDRFEPEEVAEIKNCTVDEVNNTLLQVRRELGERIRERLQEIESTVH